VHQLHQTGLWLDAGDALFRRYEDGQCSLHTTNTIPSLHFGNSANLLPRFSGVFSAICDVELDIHAKFHENLQQLLPRRRRTPRLTPFADIEGRDKWLIPPDIETSGGKLIMTSSIYGADILSDPKGKYSNDEMIYGLLQFAQELRRNSVIARYRRMLRRMLDDVERQ